VKAHGFALRFEIMENDMPSGKGRVPAQVDFDRRREPAQRVIAAVADEESRLGKVVLGGDRLHGRFRQPSLQRADRGRVAAEQAVGERIDLIDRQAHRSPGGWQRNCRVYWHNPARTAMWVRNQAV
jgi:hypothetical protein